MSLTRSSVRDLYRRRAANYDVTARLYCLIGHRDHAYRRKAVEALGLKSGATVVELCCGTGLNFPLLQNAVGPSGRVIGVDLTDSMLEQAAERVRRNHWNNVDLIEADVASYPVPDNVDGVISTFALTFLPEYPQVIRRCADALRPGACMVVLDFKRPQNAPDFLARISVAIMRPFGATMDLAERHPWESMRQCFGNLSLDNLYFGFSYVACSRRPYPSEEPTLAT